MSELHWQKQQPDAPLFPDILWSRPESKAGAGKLAIIGGNSLAFSAPGNAYTCAMEAGAGVIKVLLPEAIKKNVSVFLPEADYGPSNRSGSFAQSAIAEFSDLSRWADATLLAGDFGRNSETSIVLESFVGKYEGLLTITHDAVDYFKETPLQLVDRPDTLLVLSLAQLQRIFITTPSITAITYSMSIQQLVEALHDYTSKHPAAIVTKLNDLLFIAYSGNIITQKDDRKIWRVETAAKASVFWLQNPTKPLEAIASSIAKIKLHD